MKQTEEINFAKGGNLSIATKTSEVIIFYIWVISLEGIPILIKWTGNTLKTDNTLSWNVWCPFSKGNNSSRVCFLHLENPF